MKIFLLGHEGKVGSVLGPALEEAGHELVESAAGADAAVDFTRPDAVEGNVRACLEAGVPCVVGTTGFDQERVAALAVDYDLPVFYAPNFALGAVLMMRFAADAARCSRTRQSWSCTTRRSSTRPRAPRRRPPRCSLTGRRSTPSGCRASSPTRR